LSRDVKRTAEDRTEDLLYELYAFLAPVLAAEFHNVAELEASELAVLQTIAASLGIANVEQAEDSPDVLYRVWEPVARSTALTLLDAFSISERPATEWDSAELYRRARDAADVPALLEETGMDEDDFSIALALAARALAQWPRLSTPLGLYYDSKYLTLHASGAIFSCLRTRNLPLLGLSNESFNHGKVRNTLRAQVNVPTIVSLAPEIAVKTTDVGSSTLFVITALADGEGALSTGAHLELDGETKPTIRSDQILLPTHEGAVLRLGASIAHKVRWGTIIEWNPLGDSVEDGDSWVEAGAAVSVPQYRPGQRQRVRRVVNR
jgi:hypothetical protein